MSMATVARWLILRLQAERKEGKQVVTTCLVGSFLLICFFMGVITYVITSPIELLGLMGELQLSAADTSFGTAARSEPLSETEIERLAGQFQNPKQQALFQAALRLVGQVPYFWGGKSGPGWNEEWGTPKLVTASGVSSTGTIRPYGLDCSGYVAWAFDTAGLTDTLQRGGTAWQWAATEAITADELQPGDLAFQQTPYDSGINHMGIYLGEGPGGTLRFLHCSAGDGGVTLNSYAGFRHFRRLKGVFDD